MAKRNRRRETPYVTEREKRERLQKEARAAAESFRRIGALLPVYDRPEVVGSMIGQGLVTLAEMQAAHARLPAAAAARIAGERA